MRVLRRIVPLVLLAAVVGAVVLVVTARPDIEDARDAAQARWDALVPALDGRYALLADANARLGDVSPTLEPLVADVDGALARWRETGEAGAGATTRVRAANDLEGLGRRLLAAAGASPLVAGDEAAKAAVGAFRAAPVPEPLPAFQQAVAAYDEERAGIARGLVAAVFGYDEIPALDLP